MSNMHLEDEPLVSVVMPAYNSERTIESSIRSILAQSYRSLELLVVNDGSVDNTKEIVAQFLSDGRVRYFENSQNLGVALTRNVGIKEARGEYIAFCDADDQWLPDKLLSQINEMRRRNVLISGSNALRIGEDGTTKLTRYEGEITFQKMLIRNYIVNSSGIYCARKLGKIYQRNIGHEDYDMWLRLLKRTDAVVLADSLVIYRVANNSLSANKLKSIVWHLRVQLKIGIPKRVVLSNFIRNTLSRISG